MAKKKSKSVTESEPARVSEPEVLDLRKTHQRQSSSKKQADANGRTRNTQAIPAVGSPVRPNTRKTAAIPQPPAPPPSESTPKARPRPRPVPVPVETRVERVAKRPQPQPTVRSVKPTPVEATSSTDAVRESDEFKAAAILASLSGAVVPIDASRNITSQPEDPDGDDGEELADDALDTFLKATCDPSDGSDIEVLPVSGTQREFVDGGWREAGQEQDIEAEEEEEEEGSSSDGIEEMAPDAVPTVRHSTLKTTQPTRGLSPATQHRIDSRLGPEFGIGKGIVPTHPRASKTRTTGTRHARDSEEESEAADTTFVIPLDVPYGANCGKEVDLDSSVGWYAALGKISSIMDVDPEELSLMYTLPWKRAVGGNKPRPISLENAVEWEALKMHVKEHIQRAQSDKRYGNRPFRIAVSAQTAPRPKRKDIPSKKAEPKPAAHKRRSDALEANSGSESERKVASKKSPAEEVEMLLGGSIADYKTIMGEITARHHCKECKKACAVLENGEHHPFTMTDLAKMARMMKFGYAGITVDKLPGLIFPGALSREQWKLASNASSQAGAARSQDRSGSPPPVTAPPPPATTASTHGTANPHATPTGSSGFYGNPMGTMPTPTFQMWHPGMAYMPPFPNALMSSPFGGFGPYPPGQTTLDASQWSPHHRSSRKRHRTPDPVSSDPIEPPTTDIAYPSIRDWLQEIETPGTIRSQYEYSRWTEYFESAGYRYVDDLKATRPERLSAAVKLAIGDCERLIRWAREKCDAVQREHVYEYSARDHAPRTPRRARFY